MHHSILARACAATWLLLNWTATCGQAQTVEWIQQGGGPGQDGGHAIAVDTLGNVFVSGFTRSSLDGPNAGQEDAFVSKYTSAGEMVWIRQAGTTMSDYAWGVATDGVGGVVIAGQTEGALFGAYRGLTDGFVGNYSTDGDLTWSAQLGSNAFDYASSVTVDSVGNTYVTGRTNGFLGTRVGEGSGTGNTFVAKFDSGGSELWINRYVSTAFQDAKAIAHDGAEHFYTTGSFRGGGDIFLRQYSSNGTLIWDWDTRQISSDLSFHESRGVAADQLGNIFITGALQPNTVGFVSRFNSDGELQWTRQIGDSENRSDASAISADSAGNVYVAGRTLGGLGGPNAGEWDAFVNKYDSEGHLLWSKQFGSTESDFAYGVDATIPGTLYVTGSTRGALGPASFGDYDFFLAKIVDEPIPEPASSTLTLVAFGLACMRRR